MLRCIINYYTFVLSMVLSSAAVRQKLSHGLRCRCRTYFHCSTSLRSAIRRPAKTSVTSHCIATSCVSYRRTNYRPERSLISFFTSTGRSSQPSTLKAGLYIYYCHDRAYPFKAYCCRMGTVIKHPVPDRVKPSFVIFDIRALWRSGLSVRVPGCQKLQMTA